MIKNFDVITIDQLNGKEYAVIGQGKFTDIFLSIIKKRKIDDPIVVVDSFQAEKAAILPDNLVIGSSSFQLEIIERWTPYLRKKQRFVDVTNDVISEIFNIEACEEVPDGEKGNIVFCNEAPSVIEGVWINGLKKNLIDHGYGWKRAHPLELIDTKKLNGAKAAIIWNGSKKNHSFFIKFCRENKIPVTYAECGFFPQSDHFYLDKSGVNLSSQLKHDSLEWLTKKDFCCVKEKKEELFGGRVNRDNGYIFVPLQIESDSNIQNHSMFKNGMQEYIDFIVSNHKSENVIFKPHPKDEKSEYYNYRGAQVSFDDTLDLIASSSCVRGINSSVLFESALFGKKVIIDGECLLNSSIAKPEAMIAAMIYRQYKVKEFIYDNDKFSRFTNLDHLFA